MIHLKLRFQLFFLWTSANLILAALVGGITFSTSRQLFKEQFLDNKLALAVSLANSIEGEVHAGFTDPSAVADPEYQRYLRYLMKTKQSEEYITYLYTICYNEDTDDLVYAIDADIADIGPDGTCTDRQQT